MRDIFRHKNAGLLSLARLGSLIIAILMLGVLFISAAQAAPLPQDDRPPSSGGDGGDGGGGGGGDGVGGNGNGAGDLSEDRCASLSGEVLNWGVGGIGGVGVELSTGSWQQFSTSASEGDYGFGGLGVGVAVLRVLLPPEQGGKLQPLIQEAGVYLNCDYPIVANIALVSGGIIDPPAFIEISGPEQLIPGDNIPLKLTVKNELPTEISNVVVTDLMPPGLMAVEVTAASAEQKNLKIIDAGMDGQLVAVFLDKLAPGAEANIFITVTLAEGMRAGAKISNIATLFYRESAADQDGLELVVGAEEISRPGSTTEQSPPLAQAPAEPTAVPGANQGALPAALPEKVTPIAETEEGVAFAPPGNMPGTGGDFLFSQPSPEADGANVAAPVKPSYSSAEPLPPQIVADRGNAFSPDALHTTGLQARPVIGLIPAILLIGLGAGGLLSLFRHLRASRQEGEG